MLKGTIKFTENGFILNSNNDESQTWERGTNSYEQYIYLNGERYKLINPPKKFVEDLDDE